MWSSLSAAEFLLHEKMQKYHSFEDQKAASLAAKIRCKTATKEKEKLKSSKGGGISGTGVAAPKQSRD